MLVTIIQIVVNDIKNTKGCRFSLVYNDVAKLNT